MFLILTVIMWHRVAIDLWRDVD